MIAYGALVTEKSFQQKTASGSIYRQVPHTDCLSISLVLYYFLQGKILCCIANENHNDSAVTLEGTRLMGKIP